MSILSDQEIDEVCDIDTDYTSMLRFARAIESALLSKLSAGVSVETPYIYTEWISPGERVSRDMFNSDQLQYAIAQARVQALEEAARVCESTVWSADIDVWRDMTKKDVSVKSMLACADAIRALIGKETP